MSSDRCAVPELCLICYGKLSSKELRDRQSNGDLVPNQALEKFSVESGGRIPGRWISVCDDCTGVIAQAKLIYEEIWELCGKFRNARLQVVDKLKRSCLEDGEGGGKRRGRGVKSEGDFKRVEITDDCRKIVNERVILNMIMEEPFLVEDVNALTKRFLPNVPEQAPIIFQIIPHQFVTIPGQETGGVLVKILPAPPPTPSIVFNVDDLDDNQYDEDPLSIPDGVFTTTSVEAGDQDSKNQSEPEVEYKEDVEVKSESDDEKSIKTEDDNDDSDWESDEMEMSSGNPSDDIENDAKTISERLIFGDHNRKNECPKCNKELPTAHGLRSHLFQVHNVKILKIVEEKEKKSWTCPEENCKLVFSRQKEYKDHILYHKKGEPKYKCEMCGKTFYYTSGYISHCLRLHGVQPASISLTAECPICHSKHINAVSLRKHINLKHKDQRDQIIVKRDKLPCSWEGCEKVFATRIRLQEHISKHEGKPGYKCEICGEPLYCGQNLSRHKDAAHSGLTFNCTFCSKSFESRQQMQWHQNYVHVKRPPRSATNKRVIVKKSDIKKDKKPIGGQNIKLKLQKVPKSSSLQCYLCGKQYKNQHSLREHLKFGHEGNYSVKCNICGQGFRHNYTLKVHMVQSHKIPTENSGDLPQCQVIGCRRAFPDKKGLEVHIAKEHGESGTEKRFQCSHCGKGFHQKCKLTQHEMLHTNQETKPFKCEICGKGFANQHNRRYHQLKTHKAEKMIERRKEMKPRSFVKRKSTPNLEEKE